MAEAVAGLVLGVIPLVLLGYRQIHNSIVKYDSFDRDLRNTRRKIETMEGIFKSIIDKILSEFIEKERRETMLRDLNEENWEQDLGRGLRSELELLFTPMVNSIYGAKETVEKIKMTLLGLDQRSPFSALADYAMRALNLTRTDSTRPPVNTDRKRSRRRKLKIIASGTVVELETLLDELKEHNNNLLAILHCRTACRIAPRAYTYNTLPQVLSCALAVENPVCGASKVRPNPIAMQIASKRLYKIVSKTLPCKCHTLHLRLEKPAEDKSKPSSVIEPPTDFSFLLAARCGGDSEREPADTKNPIIPFIFTASGWESANIMTEDCGLKGICQELFDSEGEYERYFRDNGIDGNSGFLLRRTSVGKVPVINSNPISLHDLVSSRSIQLEQYDCFQIAANLFYSILPFYSSPWIRNWTQQSIQFFDKHELAASQSVPTSWTPHVSLSIDRSDHQFQFAMENWEIRSLGIMLLELGRKKRLELSDGDGDERVALEKALIDLITNMGPGYKNIVERCLGRWSERNMDLMMEENLRDFLSDLSFLEDRAQYYTPETWCKTGLVDGGGAGQCVM